MQAKKTSEARESRGLDDDKEGPMDLDKVSISGAPDAGHTMDHFFGTTLIEHIVEFMERYN
jgi:hypothetical protein